MKKITFTIIEKCMYFQLKMFFFISKKKRVEISFNFFSVILTQRVQFNNSIQFISI